MPIPRPKARPKARPKTKPILTARNADRHGLYELAVQNPHAEVDFITRQFKRIRGRPARKIREDFCGTGAVCAEWVRRHRDNVAYGLDLDRKTLEWGSKRHGSDLSADQASRRRLLRRNVLSPGRAESGVDAVLAMNFSYWIFKTRKELIKYFRIVHRTMVRDGVFFLDHFGGWEAIREQTDRRRRPGFTYLWEQHSFDPVTFDAVCKIHFEFRDGTAIRNVFTYHWRMWQLPELREALLEAGFRNVRIYWEGDDDKGGGNGIFREVRSAEVCPVHVTYIAAEK
ncbi:MAG: class I SAM-dependent methyltransferase [Phycisphaerales bacterium]|nr:class I SAM-dependent methyltransferase [Phycisphaerales bacterium]